MMRFVKHSGSLLSILLMVGLLPRPAVAAKPRAALEERTRFDWLDNLDEARLLARAQDRPILIVFRCEP